MSWFAQDDNDHKPQRVTGRLNLGPLSPTFQSSVFGVTKTGGSEGLYSTREEKGSSKISGRFKPEVHAGIDPKSQQESHFNQEYKKVAIKEELRNDYNNFLINNSRKREEDLTLKKGDKEVLGDMEQTKQRDNQKLREMKQRQFEQREEYRHGLTAQVAESKSQKVLAQEKTKEEMNSVKPLFTPHYKKPEDNTNPLTTGVLSEQVREKAAQREQERLQKEGDREQMNRNFQEYQTKVKETHNHKHSQKHELKLQTHADITNKVTEKRLKVQQDREEDNQRLQNAAEEYAQKIRENQQKKKEKAKAYSTDIAVQLEELNDNREKQRQERLAAPRGVLTGKEATERDIELKEKSWKNKQIAKKNYSQALQENIVVKQVHQEKNKIKDQEIAGGGLKIGEYKGHDKKKVKEELAFQMQEKEAQRERERQDSKYVKAKSPRASSVSTATARASRESTPD